MLSGSEKKWLLRLSLAAAILFAADFISFAHYSEYQIEEYAPGGKSYQEHYAFMQGPVFLLLGNATARAWKFVDRDSDAIIAAFTMLIFIVTGLLPASRASLLHGATTSAHDPRDCLKREQDGRTV